MRFLLIGAGAVGCWIGANLLRVSHDVVFVGRNTFVEAARGDGLRVKLPGESGWHVRTVQAYTNVAESVEASAGAPFHAVIACMKAYAVGDAVAELRASADAMQNALFLPFQNGVGSDAIFAEAFGADRIVAATLTSPVSLETANVIRLERTRGGVGLAPLSPWGRGRVTGTDSLKFGEVTQAFVSAPLLHTSVYGDARALRWSKLLLNIVGNATSAILAKTVAEIYTDPVWSRVELRMLRECVRVIDAQNIAVVNLPGAPALWLARAVRILPDALLRLVMRRAFARARGDKRPSLYHDVAQRTGRSEVSWLNGAVAHAAQSRGLQAPMNQLLTNLLAAMVQPDAVMTLEEARRRLAEGVEGGVKH